MKKFLSRIFTIFLVCLTVNLSIGMLPIFQSQAYAYSINEGRNCVGQHPGSAVFSGQWAINAGKAVCREDKNHGSGTISINNFDPCVARESNGTKHDGEFRQNATWPEPPFTPTHKCKAN